MSLELNKKELLYFLSSQTNVTYEKIGDRLKLSKRSVKLLIESLLYSYGHIFSIQEKGEQLVLTVFEQDLFKDLVSEELLQTTDFNSFHKRQAVFLKRLLDADSYISADDVAEEIGISRRSLSRDMARMKEIVKGYQLNLHSKAGVGIKLSGSELNKRLLYLYEVMNYIDDEIELPAEVVETYTDFIASMNFPIDVTRAFLSTLKLTWTRRFTELDEEDFTWFTRQDHLDLPAIIYDILEFYWQRPLTEVEKYFLTFPMQLGLIATDAERPDVLAIVKDILAVTIKEYGIQLDIEEDALLIQRHVIYLLNRSVVKWTWTETGLRQQLIRSAFSTVVSRFFIESLAEKVEISIAEGEILLLAAWMELLLARKSKPLISRIAVISQAGFSFNRLVEMQVKEIFGSESQVDFLEFTNHAPYEELEKKYDLVFTDNLLYSQELFQSFLSLTLVTRENRAEKEKIEQTVLARKIQLYCQVERVDFNPEKTYEANLDELMQRLKVCLSLKQDDVERLLEKEKRHPSISEQGFAYPHLTAEAVEQITIIVAEQETVDLKSQTGIQVKDFILLLIPSELDEFHQNLLYNIFDNTFRTEQGTLQERLGVPFMTDLGKI